MGLLSEGSLENLWFGVGQGEIGEAKWSGTGEGRAASQCCAAGKPCPGAKAVSPVPAGLALQAGLRAHRGAEGVSWRILS